MPDALWLSEADVVSLLDLPSAIGALRDVLELEAAGEARNMTKTVATWGHGDTLHAIGAVVPGMDLVGTKTWAHTEGGATPLLVLWNSANGSLEAIIEAFALGQLRTAGISGIATDLLARPDAEVMCIVGSGKQAFPQVAAVAAVRSLREVRVYSPTAGNRRRLVERLREEFTFAVVEADSVDEAVNGSDIITLATRATDPFLREHAPRAGAHVNAMGAIVPSRMEFDPQLLERCAVVAADSPEQARSLSREFQAAYEPGRWTTVKPLSRLVADRIVRPAGADLTLFKAMGMGISDVGLGRHVLAAARMRALGRTIPSPRRAPITYFASTTV